MMRTWTSTRIPMTGMGSGLGRIRLRGVGRLGSFWIDIYRGIHSVNGSFIRSINNFRRSSAEKKCRI